MIEQCCTCRHWYADDGELITCHLYRCAFEDCCTPPDMCCNGGWEPKEGE